MAATPTQFILFDTTTGNRYHDADGNGLGARVLFASLGTTYTGWCGRGGLRRRQLWGLMDR